MKKIFSITAIIIGLAIVVMAYAFKTNSETKTQTGDGCWIEPMVKLTGDCVSYNENADYHVRMVIVDICNSNNLLYDSTNIFLSDVNITSFCVPNQLCSIDETEKCFKVYVSAIKKDNNSGEIICSGQNSAGPFTCQELMGFSYIEVPMN